MDTPSVKFFQTRDGASVAYAVHGNGPPLVVPAWWVSQLELDWQDVAYRFFFHTLGEHFSVIRYDRPGTGLSDRNRQSFTLLDEYNTLVQLIDHLDLTELSLLGISCGGPAALMFASQHPHRVQKLVFIGSFLFGGDIAPPEVQDALEGLVAAHWGLGAKAILDLFDPNMSTKTRSSISRSHRQSASAEMAKKLLKLTFEMDARSCAEHVLCPTLILHRNSDRTVGADAGRRLAAAVPDAVFKSVDGVAHLPWVGEGSQRLLDETIHFVVESDAALSKENSSLCKFRLLGDVWALSFGGQSVHLKDAVGLRDLHCLISQPERQFSAQFLYSGESEPISSAPAEVLDRETIAACRERLRDIALHKKQHGAAADVMLYERLDDEERQLLSYLGPALSLAGESRAFNDEKEKMRKAVTARIRASIKRIAVVLPALAGHLQDQVKTGSLCSYSNPDKTHWHL